MFHPTKRRRLLRRSTISLEILEVQLQGPLHKEQIHDEPEQQHCKYRTLHSIWSNIRCGSIKIQHQWSHTLFKTWRSYWCWSNSALDPCQPAWSSSGNLVIFRVVTNRKRPSVIFSDGKKAEKPMEHLRVTQTGQQGSRWCWKYWGFSFTLIWFVICMSF